MAKTFRVLAFLLATEVVIQAMAIAYAMFGLDRWIEDGHTLTKQMWDDSSAHYGGAAGFAIHGINGQVLIPLITLVMFGISFGSKLPDAVKRASILLGLVVVQVVLGLASHSAPALAPLHGLVAFAMFGLAAMTGVKASQAIKAAV